MVKASLTMADGRRLLILGLSDLNLEQLKKGKPIKVDLEPFGMEGAVAIMHGKTEEDITEELSKHFKLPQ